MLVIIATKELFTVVSCFINSTLLSSSKYKTTSLMYISETYSYHSNSLTYVKMPGNCIFCLQAEYFSDFCSKKLYNCVTFLVIAVDVIYELSCWINCSVSRIFYDMCQSSEVKSNVSVLVFMLLEILACYIALNIDKLILECRSNVRRCGRVT